MTVGTRDEFNTAATAYEAALTEWRSNINALREAQAALRAAEWDLETLEAELLLNLEVPERSNAETRAALLRQTCANHHVWLKLAAAAETARSDVAARTDAAQAARDRMSSEKRKMDFSIAWLRFLANRLD